MAKVNKVAVSVQLTESQFKQIYTLSQLVGLSFSETMRLVLIECHEITEKLLNDFKKEAK